MSDDLLNALKRSVEMRSDAKPVQPPSDEAKEIERLIQLHHRQIGIENSSAGCAACDALNLARRLLAERDEAREKLVGFVQAGAEAVVERDELQQLFDLQHTRSVQADKLWRQAHPGNELVQPDLGKLLEWLIARIASLERPCVNCRAHGRKCER